MTTTRRCTLTWLTVAVLAGVAPAVPAHARTAAQHPKTTPGAAVEEFWEAVENDMLDHARNLRRTPEGPYREAGVYQAKLIRSILRKNNSKTTAIRIANAFCERLATPEENGVLSALGYHIATTPTGSAFPGYFPSNRAGLRAEITTILKRHSIARSGILCPDRAGEAAQTVDLWWGAGRAALLARTVARDVRGDGIAGAVERRCGTPVTSSTENTCQGPGAPEGLRYVYEADIPDTVTFIHGDAAAACSVTVTLVQRTARQSTPEVGHIMCYVRDKGAAPVP